MKTRGRGRSVMTAGVACIILYIRLALRQPPTFDAGAANILFYAGVVAIPERAGAIEQKEKGEGLTLALFITSG